LNCGSIAGGVDAMSDMNAALTYANELYATEMEWHRAYEEKVMRYQPLSGAVLGVGALALSNVQFPFASARERVFWNRILGVRRARRSGAS